MTLTLILSLLAFVTGVMLFPFYVFESGVPQPAHLFFFGGAVVAMLFACPESVRFMRSRLSAALMLFVAYVFLVNLCTGLYLAAPGEGLWDVVSDPTIYSMYYLFNAAVFIGVVCIQQNARRTHRPEAFWNVTLWATLTCLFLQTMIGLLDLGKSYHTYRSILYFNNPNQLGYFAVAACSILFVVQRYRRRGSQIWVVAGYVMAVYLAALSMSKAAFLAILLMPVLHVLAGGGMGISRFAATGAAFVIIVVAAGFVGDDVVDNLSHRLSSIGAHGDDSLEGRAYDRLLDYPHHLILGAGEGSRFDHEIHSLPASLAFSYGLFGSVIFIWFVWMIYCRAGALPMLYLLPIGLYNLTHNGIRSPLLWAVMALMLSGALTVSPMSAPTRRSSRTLPGRRRRAGAAAPGMR